MGDAKVTVDKRYGTFEAPATGQAPEVVPPSRRRSPTRSGPTTSPTTEPLPGDLPGTPGNPTQQGG